MHALAVFKLIIIYIIIIICKVFKLIDSGEMVHVGLQETRGRPRISGQSRGRGPWWAWWGPSCA